MTRTVTLTALGLVAVAGLLIRAFYVPPLSLEELRRRHTLPESAFEKILGLDIHVVVEGQGPTIVLLHGHLNSLRIWDRWASDLKRDHRVLRFDMPWYGLSSKGASGTPGVVQTYRVLEELLTRHSTGDVVLVGTANGGPPLAWYAYHHADRVRAVVLINTPFEPPAAIDRGSRLRNFLEENVFSAWGRPKWATAWFLSAVIRSPDRRSADLTDLVYDLNRREGDAPVLEKFGTSTRFDSPALNPQQLSALAMLRTLQTPLLIQWSERGYLQPSEGTKLQGSAANATLLTYPAAGHWLPADAADAALQDLRRFIQ